MFFTSFLFELKYRLRSVATWACLLAMIVMGYREMLGGEWDTLMQSGRVARNSPYAIYYLFMYYTFWAATVGSALVIPTLLRDLNSKTADYLYSFDINSKHYFIGKYLACLVVVLLVMSSVVIAMVTLPVVSNFFGLYPSSDFIATSWPHIFHAILLWVLPACIVYTAIPFALTALTGRATPAYAAMMIAVGSFVLITALFGDGAPQSPWLQIVDPLGKVTVEGQIFYWTAEQRMTQFLSLDTALLSNRLLYLTLALALLVFAWWRFDLAAFRTSNGQKSSTKAITTVQQHPPSTGKLNMTALTLISNDAIAYWLKFSVRTGYLQARQIITNKAFYFSMLTLSLMLIIAGLSYRLPGIEGSAAILPKTHTLLSVLIYPSLIFTMLAAGFFVVDQCHKDHQLNTAQLVAVCPSPDWQAPLSHIVSAIIIAFVLTLVPISGLLGTQFIQGYVDSDWQSLWHLSFIVLLPLMLAYVFIAIISYGLLQSKIAAQVLAVMLCISPAIFNETNAVENFMLLWAWPSIAQLSEIASMEQFITRDINLMIYWLSFYCVLLVFVSWLWPRGMITPCKERIAALPRKIAPRSLAIMLLAATTFVYQAHTIYQAMIINGQFETQADGYAKQVEYEQQYRQFNTQPQPKISHAKIALTLHPNKRALDYKANLTLINPNKTTINQLLLNTNDFTSINNISTEGQALSALLTDETHHVSLWGLNIAPEKNTQLSIAASVQYQGYRNIATDYLGKISKDASYIDAEFWPSIGFEKNKIINDRALRNKHKLNPFTIDTANQSTAAKVYQHNDANLITYTLQIEAPNDQIVVAPGELISHQALGQRHLYEYETTTASYWKPAIVSAKYQTRKTSWVSTKTAQEIPIELFYINTDEVILDAILQQAKHALEQGERVFGSYPYASLKIAALPQGMGKQTVSANLVLIPEMSAWQHSSSQPSNINWAGYTLHHAIAQVWWQNIAIANSAGYPLLSEGVPSWFALSKSGLSSKAKQQLLSAITDDYLLARTKESGIEKNALQLTLQPYAKSKAQVAIYTASQLIGDKHFSHIINNIVVNYHAQQGAQFLSAELLYLQMSQPPKHAQYKKQLDGLFSENGALFDIAYSNITSEL